MNILIIGGTGLISTPMTRYLLERGEAVTHFHRGGSTSPDAGKLQHMQGDRTDYATFERHMAEAGTFDCVIDMVGYEPEDARSAVRAFRGRVGHYIFCSTVDVYTKPAGRYPILEHESRTAITGNDYALKKVICEQIIFEAHQRGYFPATIIRPGYTYGEGRGIIHSVGWKTTYEDRIRKGKPIIVHGDGTSLWTACHAEDVSRAFVGAVGNEQTFGRDYHVTGEEWLTWNRLHQQVAEAMGAPAPKLIHIPTDLLAAIAPRHAGTCAVNFQFNNIFDNTAARNDLGFRYTIPWMEGVRRVVAWLDAHHRIENSDDDPLDDQIIAAWQRLSAAIAQELAGIEAQ